MSATEDQININLAVLGFDNPSQLALFKKAAQAIGVTIDSTLTEFQNSENNILTIINDQRYGKSGYYVDNALAFQYGDNLVIDPITFDDVYAVIDTTKQIVKQAAFEEIKAGNNSQLFLKVAKLDGLSGLLAPLEPAEFAAFINYFINFEIPGIPISIISNPANILSFNAVATYFATYDLTVLQTNLAAALINFRNSFKFNGEFFIGDMQEYIKNNVPGMRDFYMTNVTIDGAPVNGSQSLQSGYFDFVANYLTLITYTAVNG